MTARYFLGFFLMAALAGCKTDNTTQDTLTPQTPVSSIANVAPKIYGFPLNKAVVGSGYVFRPAASDANGDPLTFTIANKPDWANFNTSTGELSGLPDAGHAGRYSGIIIAVSDGSAKSSMPGFEIDVVDTSLTPTIEGNPATAVMVGNAYSFAPMASDPNGAALTFSIDNKPTWAAFDSFTGRLTGTPGAGDVGSSSGIVITVSNGTESDSLPAFSIAVNQTGTGSATLSWTPPAQNIDGSVLTNLAGYKIYYGTDANALNKSVRIQNAGITTYMVGNLSPDTWYFSVKAYTSANIESDFSQKVSKTIN